MRRVGGGGGGMWRIDIDGFHAELFLLLIDVVVVVVVVV